MFLMDIAQSDDADRLLRNLDMLKDDALEAADEAARAPDPALSDLCNALRWTAADGTIRAITPVTGAWTPRGLLLTATVTVATSLSEVKVIDMFPWHLCKAALYSNMSPRTPTPSPPPWSRGGALGTPPSPRPASGTLCSGASTRPARRPRPPTPTRPRRFKTRRSLSSPEAHQPVPAPPPQANVGPPSDPIGGFRGTAQ